MDWFSRLTMVVMRLDECKNGAIGAMISFKGSLFLRMATQAARVMGTTPAQCSAWIALRNNG